jgi:hypothetical protein
MNERERIATIVKHVRSPSMAAAAARILEVQAHCLHLSYNPTIKGGFVDGRDCRVCSLCGKIDVLGAPSVSDGAKAHG